MKKLITLLPLFCFVVTLFAQDPTKGQAIEYIQDKISSPQYVGDYKIEFEIDSAKKYSITYKLTGLEDSKEAFTHLYIFDIKGISSIDVKTETNRDGYEFHCLSIHIRPNNLNATY